MKRIEQLLPLSKEHHLSLTLAKKCKDVFAKEPDDAIKRFCLMLKDDFETQWDKHFRVEEKAIFKFAEAKSKEMFDLCQQLRKEHLLMEEMVCKMSAGDYQLLEKFGQLLHDHTRLEERQLFPLVEKLFTPAELDNILKIEATYLKVGE